MGYYAFLVVVVCGSAACERLDVVEGYIEAAGLELCVEVFVVGYELVVVYEVSDGLVVEHGFIWCMGVVGVINCCEGLSLVWCRRFCVD